MLGIELNKALLAFGLYAVTFALSVVLVGFLLVVTPATFFLDSHDRNLWVGRHPAIRWSGILLKNAFGVALIVFGVLLSVPGIPGQGLLTILVGLAMMDIPGKRRLERKLVSRPKVLNAVNKLRGRFDKPPLVLTEDPGDASSPRDGA